MKKNKNKNKLTKYLVLLFLASILIFMVYQIIRFFSKPYSTDVAMEYIISDSINATGIAIRNESVIEIAPKGDNIKYTHQNAGNVKSDDVVAEVYKTESDIININKCDKINNELSLLKDIAAITVTELKPTGAISGEINSTIKNIMDLSQENRLENIDEQKIKLSTLINKKKIYMGMKNDCGERVEQLKSQYEQISSKINTPIQTIKSPYSGYFSRVVDGYEETYNKSFIDDITVDKLEKAIKSAENKTSKQTSIGKVVTDFNWFFAVPMVKSEAQKFAGKTEVTVDFHISSLAPIPATVYDIIDDSNSDKSIVILKCNYITEETLQLRVCNADISFRKYRGLRLPADCIRFKNNVKGVYVVGSYTAEFVPINIIYEEKEFVLCDEGYTVNDKGLKMYDKVVVEGVVQDGQPIKNWRS